MSGWGEVADEDSEKSSSLEIWLSEQAEAVRSESEPGDERPEPVPLVPTVWWAELIHKHCEGIPQPPQTCPIQLLSGCSGALSEGAALKAPLLYKQHVLRRASV